MRTLPFSLVHLSDVMSNSYEKSLFLSETGYQKQEQLKFTPVQSVNVSVK